MRILLTLIFLLIFQSVINAQEIEIQRSYIISTKTFSKIILETGDFINRLNQRESFFQIVIENGFENSKTERNIIIKCIGNKNRNLFNNDCREITKYLLSENSLDYSKPGSFNNFKFIANNNFESVKILNLDSNKSIIFNVDEYISLQLLLNKEDVNRDINYK